MAADPAKDAEVWKGVCDKEMRTWQSPATLTMALQAGRGNVLDSTESAPCYRVPVAGEPVTVSGMRRRPELNGVRGEICSQGVDEFGRVTVRVYDSTIPGVGGSRKMKIQPFRLMPLRTSGSSPSLLGGGMGGTTLSQDDRSSVRSCSRQGSVVSGLGGERRMTTPGSILSNAGRLRLDGGSQLGMQEA